MTEVEFSRLLSELVGTAKDLNRESDSINSLIERIEQKLRQINLGIEVWLVEDPLESTTWTEEDDEGRIRDEGTNDVELGFVKINDWVLATRKATYLRRLDEYGRPQFNLLGKPRADRLLDGSRNLRIEALARLSKLVQKMKDEGDAALKAIEAAKKLVK